MSMRRHEAPHVCCTHTHAHVLCVRTCGESSSTNRDIFSPAHRCIIVCATHTGTMNTYEPTESTNAELCSDGRVRDTHRTTRSSFHGYARTQHNDACQTDADMRSVAQSSCGLFVRYVLHASGIILRASVFVCVCVLSTGCKHFLLNKAVKKGQFVCL